MAIPTDLETVPPTSDDDDRVGEAVELFLLATEQGQPPALDDFVKRVIPALKKTFARGGSRAWSWSTA